MAKKKVAVKATAKATKKVAKKSNRDVLVVASKVKEYIKTKGVDSKILVAGDFAANLSEAVYGLIDKAIVRAQENKRSTVQPKDI
jgi:histone H3/H4